jgi:hypothetical protein
MEAKGLNSIERNSLNIKILEYNESKEPLPVFLEIMKLDLADRPQLRPVFYRIIEKIAHRQSIGYV